MTLGTLQPDHSFRAQEVLAKHDETYMPKDVADALKTVRPLEPGQWPGAAGRTWNAVPHPRSVSSLPDCPGSRRTG